MSQPSAKQKRPFLVWFIVSAVLMLVFLLCSIFLYINFLAVSQTHQQFQMKTIDYYYDIYPEQKDRFSIVPEQESYKAGTDSITFLISDRDGKVFQAHRTEYYVTKDGAPFLFRIWPTLQRMILPAPWWARASEDGSPSTMQFGVSVKEWALRPVRGSYTIWILVGFHWTDQNGQDQFGFYQIPGSFRIE